jgi:UDP-4-amino-4,6-dideoxy-N-acetyl-beta-L-altrosamine transaminase
LIPYGRQDLTQADIDAVTDVLRSDFLTQGPMVPLFEEGLAAYCGARHAVAVNSATSALHIACLALGLGEGDWLWTSPVTFVASANCAIYCGAKVDFVDIDKDTFNMSLDALSAKLESAKKLGKLPKIVVPVHLGGRSCDMARIHALSKEYGFRIVEDASHAVGGKYLGDPVGNCRYSDITVFSFHPVKIITSAEGGMAMTNDAGLAEQMKLLRSHGITRDETLLTHPSDGPWYYQQLELGFNYRMTDVQAALGASQLKRIDSYVSRRNEIAAAYDEALADLPLRSQHASDDVYSAYHLYVIRLNAGEMSISHREVFDRLRESGIGVNLHYIPVHTQPFYRAMGFSDVDFPEAESYYKEALSLPLYPGLSGSDFDHIVNTLHSILGA